MKSILSLGVAAIMLAHAPAIAGELANGAQVTKVSPSIIMIGTPAPKVEPKKAENMFDGFASHFPVTALLDDPAVAKLSLDTIIGKNNGTGKESAIAVAPQAAPSEMAKPAKAEASVKVPVTPSVPQMAVAPTPSPHPEAVAAVPPVAVDEETSSIGPKVKPAPAKLFENESLRTGN